MRARRLGLLLTLTLALALAGLFAPTISAQSTSPGVGYADLVSVGGSGIQGQLRFTDNGQSLRVYSSAPVSGFNPLKMYVTLVYGLASRGPGEASPICGRDPNLGFDEMLIGPWSPIAGATTRSLDVTKLHSAYVQILASFVWVPLQGGVKLSEARTVSIREFNPPPGSNPPADPVALTSYMLTFLTSDMPPAVFQLRSCGLIVPGNPPT